MYQNQLWTGNQRDEEQYWGLVWFGPEGRYKPIPLKSVSVVAAVVHAAGQVEITQTYRNDERNPIEVIYFFPLDSNGAVTHFHAELDERIVKGVVKTNQEAEKDYQDAVSRGQTAFLGSETKPDVFKLKIGFMKPGSEVKVVIGYVTEVKNDPDTSALRFFLPTTIAPRYVPPTSWESGTKDFQQMTYSSTTPAPLTIKVVASLQGKIKAFDCPSKHGIVIEDTGTIPSMPSWQRVVVTLSSTVTDMDRDFVLLISPEDAMMKPRIYSEALDEAGSLAVMSHFIPSFSLIEERIEAIFVIDRSGSMQGESIRMCANALELFLHSLPMNCFFNVIGFGSTYSPLFTNGSVRYDSTSMNSAKSYCHNLRADLGGTELYQPLQHVYDRPLIPGYLRQIFVLTDGEISNTEQVIGLIKRNAHNHRLFSIGIGSASSQHLVRGMAQGGGGTSTFVESDASISKAVLGQLKNALQASLTEIKIEWLGIPEVEVIKEKTLFGYNKPVDGETVSRREYFQAPRNIPPIFDGHQMVVLGVFLSQQYKPRGIKITANSPDGPLSLEIPISNESDIGSTGMLHKLAAIKLVRELELEEAGSTYFTPQKKDKIIELAVKNGISSKYTSYIAVDTDQRGCVIMTAPMERRIVPSQIPTSWGGGGGTFSFGSQQQQASQSCLFGSSTRDRGPSATAFCAKTPAFSFGFGSVGGGGLDYQCSPPSFSAFRRSQPLPQRHCYRSHSESSHSEDARISYSFGASMAPTSSFSFGSDVQHHKSYSKQASPTPRNELQTLQAIIALQEFDGSFVLNDEFCQCINLPLQKAVDETTKHGWQNTALWTTILAVTFLTKARNQQYKDFWELVVRKAEAWIASQPTHDGGEFMRARALEMIY